MKSKALKLMIAVTFAVTAGFDNTDTWTILNERTWRSDIFAGSEIIFYETANGLRKAILQIHGSGVPLAGATIFDVVTDGEGAVLKYGLDLTRRDSQPLEPIRLILTSDSVLMFGDNVYKKKCDCLVAFDWLHKIGKGGYLDIERLKIIPIGERSIYEIDSFGN